jgi:hypothetical protein
LESPSQKIYCCYSKKSIKKKIMGTIFLVFVVVIILLVIAEEWGEAFDEWRKDIDDEEDY